MRTQGTERMRVQSRVCALAYLVPNPYTPCSHSKLLSSSESSSSWFSQSSRGSAASLGATRQKASRTSGERAVSARAFIKQCSPVAVIPSLFDSDRSSAQVRSWSGVVPLATLVTGNGGRRRRRARDSAGVDHSFIWLFPILNKPARHLVSPRTRTSY